MLTVGLREWAGHSRQRPLAPGGRAAVHELGLLSISSHASPKLEPRDPETPGQRLAPGAVRVSPSLQGFFLCLVTTKLTFCSVAVLLSSGPARGTGDGSARGGVIRDTEQPAIIEEEGESAGLRWGLQEEATGPG